jgi:hypothetical protein
MILESFPLSANGKIDRKEFPDPFEIDIKHIDENIAPKNKTESEILQIWKEVLNIDSIGLNENFFDIGGHSLLLIKVYQLLVSKIIVKKDLSVIELFQYPTIYSLAKFLDHESQQNTVPDKIQDRANKQREAMKRLKRKK